MQGRKRACTYALKRQAPQTRADMSRDARPGLRVRQFVRRALLQTHGPILIGVRVCVSAHHVRGCGA
eukprot:8880815-Alexandrium_andersonii.AAC.1